MVHFASVGRISVIRQIPSASMATKITTFPACHVASTSHGGPLGSVSFTRTLPFAPRRGSSVISPPAHRGLVKRSVLCAAHRDSKASNHGVSDFSEVRTLAPTRSIRVSNFRYGPRAGDEKASNALSKRTVSPPRADAMVALISSRLGATIILPSATSTIIRLVTWRCVPSAVSLRTNRRSPRHSSRNSRASRDSTRPSFCHRPPCCSNTLARPPLKSAVGDGECRDATTKSLVAPSGCTANLTHSPVRNSLRLLVSSWRDRPRLRSAAMKSSSASHTLTNPPVSNSPSCASAFVRFRWLVVLPPCSCRRTTQTTVATNAATTEATTTRRLVVTCDSRGQSMATARKGSFPKSSGSRCCR